MKKSIFTLLLALASVCAVNAQTRDTVLVDGLYYILVTGGASPFAYVTSKGDYYAGNFAADQLDYVSGDLVIPSTVTYNGVDYPVTSIDAGAFSLCRKLKSVVIPNTVTHIAGDSRAQFTGAFYYCDSLTSVTLSENLTELGAFAFSYCTALAEITLPESLRTIGYNAFQDCEAMRSITIPEGVTFIDAEAFEYCRALQSISLPSTLTQIAYQCFVGCHKLDTVYSYALTPPNIYQEIATDKVFYDAGVSHRGNYYGLKYMKLYVPLEALSAYQAAADWDVCQNITAIGYDVYEVDGILYKRDPVAQTAEVTRTSSTNSTAQLNYVSGDVVIPETFTDDHGITYTVTGIGEAAFRDCRNLRTMTLPRTITQIGAEAFSLTYNLQSINFPDGLLSIGYDAFLDASLRTVVLTNVNSLGDGAFARCTKLQEVELPALAEIKMNTFSGCTALKRIAVNASTPPTVGRGAFQDITLSGVDCFVPDGSFSAYQAAEVWQDMNLRLLSDYQIMIHEVSLTVEWPSMGTAIESFHPYDPNEVTTTTYPANASYEVESYLFFTPSGGRITEATLQPGTEYLVRVSVLPYSGYAFADDLEIRINGYAPILIYNPGTGSVTFDTKFTTEGGLTVTVSEGGLTGLFSVADGKQIVFSKGNLQYQASTDTWRFAEHQWDNVNANGVGNVYEGGVQCDNSLISPTYTGWIDLFGWGTGDNPTKTSTGCEEYTTFVDWGTNAISNGGNQPNLWRTMTSRELHYLLFERPNAANLRAYGNIDNSDPYIFVLLPDDWVCPAGVLYDVTMFNYFTSAQIASMEAAGAVFLPVTAMRADYGMGNYANCLYWTSAPDANECNAMALNFSFGGSTTLYEYASWRRSYGLAVRLVQEPQLQISTVSLEFEAPTAGQSIEQAYLTPDSAAYNTIGRASVSTKAGYEIAGYGFYTQAGEPFTGTFQVNTAYKVQVRLRAKDGYTFPMQSANPTTPDLTQLTISLNGAAAANPQAWNTGEISAEYSFTTTTPVFTVRFLDWNGAVLSTQSVEMGQDATAPADPTREGYIFIGWDREFTNIQANTFITARYKQLITNVILSFEFPKGGQAINKIVIRPTDEEYNVIGRVTLPAGVGYEVRSYSFFDNNGSRFTGTFAADVTYRVVVELQPKEGYIFPPLASNPNYADADQINCTVNDEAPMSLNTWNDGSIGPKFSFTAKALYTVRFLDWDGTVLSTQTVTQGEDAVAPTFPSHSGYYFAGWDREFTNVQADIDVTAQYLQAIYEINPTFVFPAAGDTVTNDVMTPTHELYNVLGQISVPDGAPFHVRSYQFTDENSNYINSNSFGANGVYSVQIILEPNEGYAFNTTYEWDWSSVTFSVNGQAPYAAMAAPEGGLRLWVRFETGKISIKNISLTTEFPDYGDSIKSGPYYCDECTMPLPMSILSGDADAYYCEGVDLWEVNYDPFEEEALLPNKTYLVRFYVYPKEGHTILKTLTENDITVNGEHPYDVGTDNQDRMWFSVNFTTSKMLIDAVDLTVVTPDAGDAVTSCNNYDPDLSTLATINCPPGAPYSCSLFVFYKDGECYEETELLPNTEYIMGIELTPAEGYTFPKVIWPGTGVEYVANEQIGFTINDVAVTCGEFTVDVARCYLNFTTGDMPLTEIDAVALTFTAPEQGTQMPENNVILADDPLFNVIGSALVPPGAGYEIQEYTYYNAAGEQPEEATFLPETKYVVSIYVAPLEGYTFPLSGPFTDTDNMTITVNGAAAEPELIGAGLGIVTVGYEFTTGKAEGIENVEGDNVQSTKVLINGNLFILRGEKVYDATGRLVK